MGTSKQIIAQANAEGGFNGNNVDNPRNGNCRAIELRSRLVNISTRASNSNKESEGKMVIKGDFEN